MPNFDPSSLLKLSLELASDLDDEARIRTAINRAYYSAFISVHCWMMNNSETFGPEHIHSQVKKRLKTRDSRMASKLEQLHEDYRVVADYDPTAGAVDIEKARQAIKIAGPIVEKFNS